LVAPAFGEPPEGTGWRGAFDGYGPDGLKATLASRRVKHLHALLVDLFEEEALSKVVYKGREYFRTHDVCQMAGISKSTLLRWLRSGVVKSNSIRDRRGWRLYSKEDVDRIALVANQVSPEADRNGEDED
jgi:hypothetical protein